MSQIVINPYQDIIVKNFTLERTGFLNLLNADSLSFSPYQGHVSFAVYSYIIRTLFVDHSYKIRIVYV
jgi:hypothetical protein